MRFCANKFLLGSPHTNIKLHKWKKVHGSNPEDVKKEIESIYFAVGWKYVLVRDIAIIAYNCLNGLMHIIDVVTQKVCNNIKKAIPDSQANGMDIEFIYDKINDQIYLLKCHGAREHYRLSLFDILPIGFYADEIVNGYLKDQAESIVPLDIISIIIMYFAVIEWCLL